MKDTTLLGEKRFRVWIARYRRWQPTDCRQMPPEAVAVEPAEEGTMSREEAATYVEAFNGAALAQAGNLWAVALPVTVRYDGEPRPGQTIDLRRRRSSDKRGAEKKPATRLSGVDT